jgi:hypothetical protein
LLESIRPKVEKLTNLELSPTYSYYRVYTPGDEVKRHVDRHSCEVSTSLCLGYDYMGEPCQWHLTVGDNDVVSEPGEGVIYRGMEVFHSRPPMKAEPGSWHAQAFLHYVERNGPHAAFKFDKRIGLYYASIQG